MALDPAQKFSRSKKPLIGFWQKPIPQKKNFLTIILQKRIH